MSAADVAAIRRRVRALADPEQAAFAQRYFKTGPGQYGAGDVFLGVRSGPLRALSREFRAIRPRDAFTVLRSKYHEERLLALMVLVLQYPKADEAKRREIYTGYLARTRWINNWDLVDVSAHHIVGAHLEARSRRPLYRLARSRSMWERRIAVISTFRFIRAGDFADSLAIAEKLLVDREDLMHKAVGWMLREVGKRDRAVLEAFLHPRYRTMPRTMLRYAIERFPPSRRRRYLEGGV